jgi:hypothetical protein
MTPALTWRDPTDWSTATTDGDWYAELRRDRWVLFARDREVATFATKQDAQAAVGRIRKGN